MLQKIKAMIGGRSSWVERHFEVLLIVAALVAMTISLCIGLGQSVWFDEAYSVLIARQTPDQLLYLTSVDAHPPLYYLLLKAWAGLFGFGEVALRMFSVVAMGGAIVMAGILLRRMFSARIAIVALPFIVFAPMVLRYGFEIRMYALAMLIGMVATYVLVVALQANRRNQWLLYTLYAVLVAAGTMTLYYLALLWLAHVAWLVWRARREKKPIFRSPWFAALVGAAVLFMPWFSVFLSQIGNGALAPVTQALTLTNITSIISFMFVFEPSWQLSSFISLVVLAVIVTLTMLFVRAFRLADKKQRPHMLLLAAYIVVPIAILAAVSLVGPMYLERYLSHVFIAGYMLVGVAIGVIMTKAPSRKVHFAGAGILAVLLVGVLSLAQTGNYNFQRLQKPAVREVAAQLADCHPDKTILAADPYIAIELSYYLPDCEVRFYSQPEDLIGGFTPLADSPLHVTDPASELAGSRELVYVYYDEPTLVMPDTLIASSRTTYNQMHVAEFYAEGSR